MIEFAATFLICTKNASMLVPIIRHMIADSELWLGPAFNPPFVENVHVWENPWRSQVCFSEHGTRARIILASRVKTDPRLLAWHLAHECIHLLSPTPHATNLEEGLAVEFSMRYTAEQFGTDGWLFANTMEIGQQQYLRAWSAARRLLEAGDDIIRRIRQRQPVISNISPDLIRELASCSSDDATFLGRPFPRPVETSG